MRMSVSREGLAQCFSVLADNYLPDGKSVRSFDDAVLIRSLDRLESCLGYVKRKHCAIDNQGA
jgi:hypothetical protein